VLAGMAWLLCQRVAPGGWLVLSGLLSEQAQPTAERYGLLGVVPIEVRRDDDDPSWSAVLLQCSAS
jgi:hypothetical protein